MKDRIGSGVALLGAKSDGKVLLLAVVTKDLTDRFHAGKIVKRAAEMVGDRAEAGPIWRRLADRKWPLFWKPWVPLKNSFDGGCNYEPGPACSRDSRIETRNSVPGLRLHNGSEGQKRHRLFVDWLSDPMNGDTLLRVKVS